MARILVPLPHQVNLRMCLEQLSKLDDFPKPESNSKWKGGALGR